MFLLFLFACEPVQAPREVPLEAPDDQVPTQATRSAETLCDGLDDDQDGLVDEGVFQASLYDWPQSGQENFAIWTKPWTSWVPGLVSLAVDQTYSTGTLQTGLTDYDEQGRITFYEGTYAHEESGSFVEVEGAYRYSGDQVIYELLRYHEVTKFVEVEEDWTETFVELDELGRPERLTTVDHISGSVDLQTIVYDAQSRETEIEWLEVLEEGDPVCRSRELFVYDDQARTMHAQLDFGCNGIDLLELGESRWDAEGRLVFEGTEESYASWIWDGDELVEYAETRESSVQSVSYRYDDGRLVWAVDGFQEQFWSLTYDSNGGLLATRRFDEQGIALETRVVERSQVWGPETLDRVQRFGPDGLQEEWVVERNELGNLSALRQSRPSEGYWGIWEFEFRCGHAL